MIVFGTRRYGWVDEITGIGSVCTTFFHICFVPIVPTGSHFMVSENRGYSIPLSWKSILVAYLRAACFWTALGSVISIPASFGATCCTALPAALGYFLIPMFTRKASESRAKELRESLGL